MGDTNGCLSGGQGCVRTLTVAPLSGPIASAILRKLLPISADSSYDVRQLSVLARLDGASKASVE